MASSAVHSPIPEVHPLSINAFAAGDHASYAVPVAEQNPIMHSWDADHLVPLVKAQGARAGSEHVKNFHARPVRPVHS